MERKRKTECLVNQLRHPLTDRSTERQIQDKWNAIGEALAYLIEKKHAKLTTKKLKVRIKKTGVQLSRSKHKGFTL